VGDAEPVEEGEEVVGGRGHGGHWWATDAGAMRNANFGRIRAIGPYRARGRQQIRAL